MPIMDYFWRKGMAVGVIELSLPVCGLSIYS